MEEQPMMVESVAFSPQPERLKFNLLVTLGGSRAAAVAGSAKYDAQISGTCG